MLGPSAVGHKQKEFQREKREGGEASDFNVLCHLT